MSTEDFQRVEVRADGPIVEGDSETVAKAAAVEPDSAPGVTPAAVPTLLDTLLANGAISAEQYSSLAATTTPASAQTADAGADAPTVSIGSGGFRVKSADGESSIKIGGRVQADANLHVNDGPIDDLITDGTELRRARFEMKGTLPEGLFWAAEADFGNNGVSVKDFWAGYKGDTGPSLTFGNQKQPYSLDVEMSSNDIPFIERGVDTFLVAPFVDRAIGARIQDSGDEWFYAVGLYGDGVSPGEASLVDDEGWGVTGRYVMAPIQTDTETIHAGVRASVRHPEDPIRIRDESTNMSNLRVVDTGVLPDVNGVTLVGAEATWVDGPLSLSGEWNVANVDLPGGDSDFTSYHVAASYTLTGESRAKAYKMSAGEFKRLTAEQGGSRPLEVSARYANLDLNSGSIQGGEEGVFSLDLNWYYSANLRLLWNWSHVLDTSGGSLTTAEADGLDLFSFRVQLNF